MKFDSPATTNPIDQLKIVGRPADRIDGPLKTSGTATYAYEWHDAAPNPDARRRGLPWRAIRGWTHSRRATRLAAGPQSDLRR